MKLLTICTVFIHYVYSSTVDDYYDKDFCIGKSSGLHADPEDCRAYYDCFRGKTRHRTGLSTGLMFHPQSRTFVHSWEMDCPVTKVYREIWRKVPGSSVADLKRSNFYPCAPSKTEFNDTFCLYKLDQDDGYGQRLRSFFRAPETGHFIFQTSCDNSCQLWISSNELPAGKQLIIDQRVPSKYRNWDGSAEQLSRKISLEKGKLYYMEVLHKEDKLSDFICVGVKFPTLKKEQPISSRHLVMNTTVLQLIGCKGSIQQQNVKCQKETSCESPNQQLEKFKQSMDTSIQSLKSIPADESPSSLKRIVQVTKDCTEIINGVLEDSKKEQWRRSNLSLAMEIAEVTETFGKELAQKWSNETSTVVSSDANIALQASVLSSNSYKFSVPEFNNNWKGIRDFLALKITKGKPKNKTKVFSVIYKNLHELLPSIPKKVIENQAFEEQYHELNSRIIGSLIHPPINSQHLEVRVTFQHLKHKSNASLAPVCVWWDLTAGGVNGSGFWSTKGCQIDEAASNTTHSTCKCNHLTNFAVLMQVKSDSDLEVDKSHIVALQIITYVGCGLSLMGVTLTVFVIAALSGLRSERNLIHLNLSLSIGIFQIIFLAGIEATNNEIACTVVAVLLHYFLLVSFAWMLVEGIYLYLMVITVFENSKEQLRIFGASSYGFPGIIVLITTSVAHDGYGTDSSCWLSTAKGVIYAFVGPALAIILVNAVILIMVIREIIKIQTNGISRSTKFDLIKSGFKSSVVLLPLLGVTWLFGILALDRNTIVFQYLFALCNSLQGFLIFVFHCLLNSEIRKVMQRKKEIWSSRRTTFFPSTTTPSPAVAASTSHGAMLSDVNMMSVSDDANNGNLATGSGRVKSNLALEENGSKASQNVNDQAPVTSSCASKTLSVESSSPAWLSKKHDPGPKRIKLPPVTVPETAKRNHKRIKDKNFKQKSKGKLNSAIEPLQEET
ncbi:adhesion G protein-coupled receptor L4-like [Stylophora pistillata]|nr:adhesion G protein-coupled receptor L4-like [Stylophora pistillata]